MIAALQKKFVLISATCIFAVFSGIFLLLAYFSHHQLNQTMDTLADAISASDGVFPAFDAGNREKPSAPFPYVEIINEESRFSTRFFTVWVNEQGQVTRVNKDFVFSISEAQVEQYADNALAEGTTRGWVSDYRFKIADTDSGTAVIFVNGASNRNMSDRLLLTAFLVLLGSALMILGLTVLLSKRAVRPVAESYEKQKQFITDANHELKTPLTLILSNLDIVEAETGPNEWLNDIRSEGERMGLLINQMVTLCRMDESELPLDLTDVDLSGLVSDTVSEFQPLAVERNKQLNAQLAAGLVCLGDEALLRRVVSILLDNAVKYCDEQGSIQVRLRRSRRRAVLTVENTFREVEHLELERLFDRFYRSDKARPFTGSFGIGLSIAQSIVKKHRGSISVYKRPNTVGFRVELRER